MKNSFNSLILMLLSLAIVFIVGCQSFMSDITKLLETPPPTQKTNVLQPEKKEESSISLATNIYLSKPGHPDIKNHCESLWTNFKKNPDPQSLIGLASTIKLENSHAPCRKFLETQIRQKINNFS